MDISYTISIISLILPIIASIISAKGPKKYKNIYINFLFLSIGLSAGIIFTSIGVNLNNYLHSERLCISITQNNNNFKIKTFNAEKISSNPFISILYDCTITNIGEKPVTITTFDIASKISDSNYKNNTLIGMFDGENKIVKPVTIASNESKTYTLSIGYFLEPQIVNLLSEKYNIHDYFSFYDAMDYLSNKNTDIYNRKIEYKKPIKYSYLTLDNSTEYKVYLKTSTGKKFVQTFGYYFMYPQY